MSRHLGSLGTPRAELDMTFGYFGHEIRVNPHATDLGYTEWLHQASQVDMTAMNEVEAVNKLMEFLKELVHPDDFGTFWKAARDNHQVLADLMIVARTIVTEVSRFPTGQSSDFSTRRERRSRRSRGGSSSADGPRASATARSAPDRDRDVAARAVRSLHGRPDLQLAIIHRQEAKAAAVA